MTLLRTPQHCTKLCSEAQCTLKANLFIQGVGGYHKVEKRKLSLNKFTQLVQIVSHDPMKQCRHIVRDIFFNINTLEASMVPLERNTLILSLRSHGQVNKCQGSLQGSNGLRLCKGQRGKKGGFQAARRSKWASLELLDHP